MKNGATPFEAPSPGATDPRIVTVSSYRAARIIGVTPRTLRRWVKEGRLRAVTTPSGGRRIAKTEVLAAAARYRDKSPEADAAARTAALETAVFEMFRQKAPLVRIVAELGVPVAYVRELWKIYSAGLPYEHPEATSGMAAGRSLADHDADVRREEEAREKEIRDAEAEMKKRQERLEKEHRESLEAHRAVLEGREPTKRRVTR
jgi:excisionase family DNA binding protein